ncbi:MAG: hypothetical protein LKH74_10945 [Levilactobacillus sp.]|jgi:hypothetical protein|uniref:hypothetical protein n=1 Tax=Levilactobacillus sp. TaxID=2767919 RepID=UPI00258C8ECA|nr:hypothetical protein [Levilactobacillus sp.]MCI1554426.1 hypothetical protein [Levilactobacillus sp.]MCI1598243.1 hypothetical protein [Levilactobacillus sp.]MCI1605908.1 hypothetical protein [Levilactobacillus sp.]
MFKKYLPELGGLLVVGGVLLYQHYRHLSGIILLETGLLGIAVILGIGHLWSLWRNRR